jgi:hypothetical protein
MGEYMRGSGRIMICMVRGSINGRMAECIRAVILKTRRKAMGFIRTQMAANMPECG